MQNSAFGMVSQRQDRIVIPNDVRDLRFLPTVEMTKDDDFDVATGARRRRGLTERRNS
jgi:hypothetical protein